ncbi:DNA adenine methylase [Asticcacaulis sp. ZE23SCel15]|uniref:DNA adenine methylase n=1 Tax=Asticcacaulis sp. ZE23SCel15 TaxID=3059027 RepID=UPI00265E9623|nr:DNA adenine methylase [Asticcacaulis sp. ZE23SCel15]WKL57255.1 DNA adenine methylase [Asticcacaulis sp. ZE23SCel15]
MNALTRPLVRYHGGKWMLADWIISHFPVHRIYVEPYGGGGSVLLKKDRSYAEVYNDLDSEVVNLFTVVRERGDELVQQLELTPFARETYVEAWYPSEDPMQQAVRTVTRAYMGFGSASVTMGRCPQRAGRGGLVKSGFRANSSRSGTTPAHDWRNYPAALPAIIDRLRGVVIENRPAIAVMTAHDGPQTLHYVDPPYVPETRDKGGDYAFEMDVADHEELAAFLNTLTGYVIVSGYPSALYDRLFFDWRRIEKGHRADGAAKRIECLWLSPNVPQTGLFEGVHP